VDAYAKKVPHYRQGAQIQAQWRAQNQDQTNPPPGQQPREMVNNLFLKHVGWRAAEGFGQAALGCPT
jgi:hypothetical protein